MRDDWGVRGDWGVGGRILNLLILALTLSVKHFRGNVFFCMDVEFRKMYNYQLLF